MIVMIDNYDSFVYNLVQYFGHLGAEMRVVRNDAITPDEVAGLRPEAIVLSPGPCSPTEAGVTVPLVRRFAGQIPLLGICLGHQAIGEAFGARVRRAGRPMHGKTSWITHDGQGCFAGLPNPLEVARYHSLALEASTLPEDLVVTATSPDGEVMGIRHRTWPVEGLQFHPESLFTHGGMTMVANFLNSVRAFQADTAARSRPERSERA